MFVGYQEARLVPGKPGIAFIEFDTDLQVRLDLLYLFILLISKKKETHRRQKFKIFIFLNCRLV